MHCPHWIETGITGFLVSCTINSLVFVTMLQMTLLTPCEKGFHPVLCLITLPDGKWQMACICIYNLIGSHVFYQVLFKQCTIFLVFCCVSSNFMGLVDGIKSKMKLCLVCLLARILNYFKLFLNHGFDGGGSDFFFSFIFYILTFGGKLKLQN